MWLVTLNFGLIFKWESEHKNTWLVNSAGWIVFFPAGMEIYKDFPFYIIKLSKVIFHMLL